MNMEIEDNLFDNNMEGNCKLDAEEEDQDSMIYEESDNNEEDSDSDWGAKNKKKRNDARMAQISSSSKQGFQTTIKIPILSSASK